MGLTVLTVGRPSPGATDSSEYFPWSQPFPSTPPPKQPCELNRVVLIDEDVGVQWKSWGLTPSPLLDHPFPQLQLQLTVQTAAQAAPQTLTSSYAMGICLCKTSHAPIYTENTIKRTPITCYQCLSLEMGEWPILGFEAVIHYS